MVEQTLCAQLVYQNSKMLFFNTSAASSVKVSAVTCLSNLLSQKSFIKARPSSSEIFGSRPKISIVQRTVPSGS